MVTALQASLLVALVASPALAAPQSPPGTTKLAVIQPDPVTVDAARPPASHPT
jgi:hypothetical protein